MSPSKPLWRDRPTPNTEAERISDEDDVSLKPVR
jgi:hypothetical protein